MKLLGSTTSPYVRRLRILLRDNYYEFINLDIFSEEGYKTLNANNPTNRVPALIDDQQTIYDSRIIYRYLAEKFDYPACSWQQENLFTLIDAANDSLVSLLLSQRSGFDTKEDKLFFNLQYQRVESILAVLNDEVEQQAFAEWDYLAICLFCLLDWIDFRELVDFNKYRNLVEFYQKALNFPGVAETDPR